MKSVQIGLEEDERDRVQVDYERGYFGTGERLKTQSSKKPIRIFIDGVFYKCVFDKKELKETLQSIAEEEMGENKNLP